MYDGNKKYDKVSEHGSSISEKQIRCPTFDSLSSTDSADKTLVRLGHLSFPLRSKYRNLTVGPF